MCGSLNGSLGQCVHRNETYIPIGDGKQKLVNKLRAL